jgi:hypothetical protein
MDTPTNPSLIYVTKFCALLTLLHVHLSLSELITNFKKVQGIHKNHPTDRENKNLLKHAPYSSITERWTGRGGSKS